MKYCQELFKDHKTINFQIIDIINLPCSDKDPSIDTTMYHKKLPTKELKNITSLYKKCDGILFLSPTYNWGITSTLKNFIDWMEPFPSNSPKACAIIGAAGRNLSLESNLQLRQIGVMMNYLFVNKPFIGINIWGGEDKFDKKFIPSEKTHKNIEKLLKNLVILILKLKKGPDFV